MNLFKKILNKLLITESVSVKDIEDAIDNHTRVIINYDSTKGMGLNTGARVIEVYAYGLTKSGNPVLRAFQPYGDTTSRVPSWKFFRIDRISAWQPTKQSFTMSADNYYENIGSFNSSGDDSMSVVYKIANFGDTNQETTQTTPDSQPKSKEDVYKTDTEKNMERLKQQLDNPINLSDIKNGDAFKQINQQQSKESGPKTKDDVYKTNTEKNMERLKQQLDNPQIIDLSQFEKSSSEKQNADLEKLRKIIGDKPITLADLNKKMKEETPNDVYKTDTEKNMERLKQQLDNPQIIDLSKFKK